MNKFICALSAVAALTFCGCKKTDTSAKGILTSGKWQLLSSTSNITIEGRAPATEDNYAKMEACERDNYFIFNANGTGTTDEGATKCSATNPQTESSGNWALLDNDTKLQLGNPVQANITITADILQLDDSILKIRYTISSGGYTSVTTTLMGHIK